MRPKLGRNIGAVVSSWWKTATALRSFIVLSQKQFPPPLPPHPHHLQRAPLMYCSRAKVVGGLFVRRGEGD